MFTTHNDRVALLVGVIWSLLSYVRADSVVARCDTHCVYMNPKIYCYGGQEQENIMTGSYGPSLDRNIFNSLDLSQDMSIRDMQNRWEPIPHEDPGPNVVFQMVAVPDYQVIFLDGGAGRSMPGSASLRANYRNIVYNITTESWSTDIPMREDNLIFHAATLGPNNRVYIWGGRAMLENGTEQPAKFPLEMYLFDFTTLSWSTESGAQSLRDTRVLHRSVLGKDGVSIYYVGGIFPDQPMYQNMSEYYFDYDYMDNIIIFNTNTSQWSRRNATGERPFIRNSHSLTLKPTTGELIMFGGTYPFNYTLFCDDYFYILDPESMVWYNRPLTVPDDVDYNVTAIFDHSAVMVGDNLYIMFGVVPPGRVTNTVRVLNTVTWSWVNSVSGVQTTDAAPQPSDTGDTNAGTIAGAVVGAVAGVALIGALIVFFYHRRRQARKKQEAKAINEHASEGSADIKHNIMIPLATQDSRGQVPNEFDKLDRDVPRIHAAEKPDGGVSSEGTQRLLMTPVKPDGA
ncbi:hypothetical protein BJV82DRAFT_590341 [Fennellomyces sp. T-0311]|nr:hypothetical protein BJV82DRAFT_590341 [Fennellomyces sp. T-0311]